VPLGATSCKKFPDSDGFGGNGLVASPRSGSPSAEKALWKIDCENSWLKRACRYTISGLFAHSSECLLFFTGKHGPAASNRHFFYVSNFGHIATGSLVHYTDGGIESFIYKGG